MYAGLPVYPHAKPGAVPAFLLRAVRFNHSFHLCYMKTIVVPTDFSSSAEHAILYAGELAKKINASILLLHVYQMPITVSEFPVLIISADELKRNADESLEKIKETALNALPGIEIETESRMGDVVEEIEHACSKKDIVALVAGTKDMSSFERFLLGDTAYSIVKNCGMPVITVPEGAAIKLPAQIALAIDNDDKVPAQKIAEFAQLTGAQLHVLHVENEDSASPIQLPDEIKNATYHTVKDDDVTAGIQHFVTEQNIDLVLIMPHKHNLYERLFFKGHAKELITELKVPVMSIK